MGIKDGSRRATFQSWKRRLAPKVWQKPSERNSTSSNAGISQSNFYSFVSNAKKTLAGDSSLVITKKSQCVMLPTKFRSWQILVGIVMLYCSFVLPFEIAELPLVRQIFIRPIIFCLNRVVDLVLMTDLVLNFFMAIYDTKREVWITNHAHIIRSYLRGMFLLDLVAMFPFDLLPLALLGTPEHRETPYYKVLSILMLLRLLRLLRWIRLESVFSSLRNEINWDYSLATLCKYGMYIVLTIHWMACGWWYVGELEMLFDNNREMQTNWITTFFHDYDFEPPWPYDKYIAACYWSVMTASTVGYNGMPATTVECMFLIVMMMLAAFIFGYIVGTVAGITSTRSRKVQQMYQIMDDVAHFSENCNLPQRLRKKLEDYFQYRCTQAVDHDYAQLLLSQMAPSMQHVVSQYTDTRWLAKLHVFADAPPSLISKMAMSMQQQLYPPTEILFQRGDNISTLYVIMRGIVISAGRVHVKGHILGDEALLKHHISMCSARSMTYSEVNQISMSRIHDILASYPAFTHTLRIMATKKMMRYEIQAYAEAVRRMELISKEIRTDSFKKSPSTKFRSKFPSVFMSTDSFEDMQEELEDRMAASDIPDISKQYIINNLHFTKPDTKGRVAHYMFKIARFIELCDGRNQALVRAAVKIQRCFKQFKESQAKNILEQAKRLLTWATFMLKLAGSDRDMIDFWMGIAHQQLLQLGVENEDDVVRIFESMELHGCIDFDAILTSVKADKKWNRVRNLAKCAIGPLAVSSRRLRVAKDQESDPATEAKEDSEARRQEAVQMVKNVALLIVKWKDKRKQNNQPESSDSNDLEPAQGAKKKGSKKAHWRSLRLAAAATKTVKTMSIAGTEYVIDGRVNRWVTKDGRKLQKTRSEIRRERDAAEEAVAAAKADRLRRMQSRRSSARTMLPNSIEQTSNNIYRGSRATTAEIHVGKSLQARRMSRFQM